MELYSRSIIPFYSKFLPYKHPQAGFKSGSRPLQPDLNSTLLRIAAVSCSLVTPRLGGVKMGLGLTGKLGRAWVGAWVVLHGGGECILHTIFDIKLLFG